jgi:hypothetical protein
VQTDKADHVDMLECVVDLMSADILSSVLQFYNAQDCTLSTTTCQKLFQLAFTYYLKPKARDSRKLRSATWKLLRSKVAEAWTVVVGQLCPSQFPKVTRAFGALWPVQAMPPPAMPGAVAPLTFSPATTAASSSSASIFTKSFVITDAIEYMRYVCVCLCLSPPLRFLSLSFLLVSLLPLRSGLMCLFCVVLCCVVLCCFVSCCVVMVCSGVRYVRLAPTDAASIRELSEYLALHIRIHEAVRRDDSNGSNYVLLENTQFAALQHVLQMCDFAQCDEHAYIDSNAASASASAAAPAPAAPSTALTTATTPTGSSSSSSSSSSGSSSNAGSNPDYAPPPLDTETKRQLLQVFNQFVVPIYELASKRGLKSEVCVVLCCVVLCCVPLAVLMCNMCPLATL